MWGKGELGPILRNQGSATSAATVGRISARSSGGERFSPLPP